MLPLKSRVQWSVVTFNIPLYYLGCCVIPHTVCILPLQVPGRLKMTDQNIIFKNSKTGKVEQISANDIDLVNFQKFIGSWGLRVFMKNGTLHRYGGFKEGVSTYPVTAFRDLVPHT